MNITYRSYAVTVPATDLAISLEDVRQHLRLGDLRADDPYLITIIKAATRHVEQYLGRALLTQTIRDTHDKFPPTNEAILLRVGPVQTVTGITYRDDAGVLQTLDTATYVQDLFAAPARIGLAANATWPTVQNRIGAVQITYEAGYGDTPDTVPDDIRMALRLILYDLYENRADTVKKFPTAAEMILGPYRIQQLS